ncbi:unnamed protein product [Polarella glacialis]|uniref:CS domain-containing protein n=1 Tax=Polarella glacialis TaxID=89957 RepID=A0A813GQB5_POLGL|nr:unnamed protein product [Polarella glacialis]
MSHLKPPFSLHPPDEASTEHGEWRLCVELPGVGPEDFSVDLARDEARVLSSSGSWEALVCQLPVGVPRIDAAAAACRFSQRQQRLTILWPAGSGEVFAASGSREAQQQQQQQQEPQQQQQQQPPQQPQQQRPPTDVEEAVRPPGAKSNHHNNHQHTTTTTTTNRPLGAKSCPSQPAGAAETRKSVPREPQPQQPQQQQQNGGSQERPANLEELDARIAALTEECSGIRAKKKVERVSQTSTTADQQDDRLAKTVAAQIAKLHSDGVKGPEGESPSEHLAGVVDMALAMSGRAEAPPERARLLVLVGKALPRSSRLRGGLNELRARVFAQAVEVLEEDPESSRRGAQRQVRGEALSLAGQAHADLGEDALAETKLQEAVAVLSKLGAEDEVGKTLLAAAHKMLAEICSRLRPTEGAAGKHVQAAEGILQKLQEKRSAEEAEAAEVFAVPPTAERLPVWKYAFSDSERHVTFRVTLDEALYKGASGMVASRRHVQAVFDEGSQTAVELRLAAPRASPDVDLACWVLRLAPLYRAVVPQATEVKLRPKYVELRLLKEEAAPWYDNPLKG